MTPLRWVNAGALVLGAVGLLISWASLSVFNVTGIDTDDGKLFGVVLILTALCGLWYVIRTNRFAAVLMLLGWVGLLSLAVYEIVNVSSVKVPLFGSVNVGAGLYVDAIAGALGTLTGAIDVSHTWSRQGSPRATWLLWTTGIVAILAAVGAGIGGHNGHNNVISNTSNNPPANFGNTGSGSSGSTGSGNTGFGNTGTGSTGSGNTGVGNSGNT